MLSHIFYVCARNLMDPNSDLLSGRGVWIPTNPFEAQWFGIAQWFGLQSDIALNYVLPNMNNFGCRLYSETDMYNDGTGKKKEKGPNQCLCLSYL